MIDAPLTLAFAAGLVATVNPCGFAMLPAYLSYFMGLEEDQTSRSRAMRSALAVGTVVSTGFLVVFGLTGLLITAGFRSVIGAMPWFAGVVGVGIVALGISLLFGREVTIGLPKARRATSGRGYRSVFLFGVSYAVASLSCTLPVFLTVVATQATRGSFVSGVATFLAYASGMALVLMAITVALAVGKRSLVAGLGGAGRSVGRVSGAILVATGSYIVWFWSVNIRSGTGAVGPGAGRCRRRCDRRRAVRLARSDGPVSHGRFARCMTRRSLTPRSSRHWSPKQYPSSEGGPR